ncbi:MAG: hypothetical protein JW774_05580 [Candidatus Aureabacteria bacterium]|nr:hypothetical protein [Candidatus Auribacterota bacterium]
MKNLLIITICFSCISADFPSESSALDHAASGSQYQLAPGSIYRPIKLDPLEKSRIEKIAGNYLISERAKISTLGVPEKKSLSEVLDSFKRLRTPPGAVFKISNLSLEDVTALGRNKEKDPSEPLVDFEVGLYRIRGSNDWIVLKGDAEGLPDISGILGVSRAVFSVDIHNHLGEKKPIPGPLDFTLEVNSGNTRRKTTKLLIGEEGLTRFHARNWKSVYSEEIAFTVNREHIERYKLVHAKLLEHDQLRYKEKFKRDFKFTTEFFRWETADLTWFDQDQYNVIADLQSDNPRDRQGALIFLIEILKKSSVDELTALVELLMKFSSDISQEIQMFILLEIRILLLTSELETEIFLPILNQFSQSIYPPVRELALEALSWKKVRRSMRPLGENPTLTAL